MPIGKLRGARNEFDDQLDAARNLANSAASWVPVGSDYYALLELAFMKGFIAWEVFVERAFFLYARGSPAPNGFRPSRYVRPIDDDHVAKFLQPPPIRYVDWTAPEAIRSRAIAFFQDGEPFESALASSTHFLHDMKKVRNAIAHSSADATGKFEGYATLALGRSASGIAPGEFLLATKPQSGGSTFFEDNLRQLAALAHVLVP